MDEDLKMVLQRHWIKHASSPQPQIESQLFQELGTLREGGYSTLARQKANALAEINTEKQVADLTKAYIVLKIPNALREHNMVSYPILKGISLLSLWLIPSFALLIYGDITVAIGIVWLSLGWFLAGILGLWWFDGTQVTYMKLGRNKYLVEIEPENYANNLPMQIVQQTATIRKQGFEPKIWAVMSLSEAKAMLPRQCPVLVGRRSDLGNHVVLFAIWGKDIEEINSVFERE